MQKLTFSILFLLASVSLQAKVNLHFNDFCSHGYGYDVREQLYDVAELVNHRADSLISEIECFQKEYPNIQKSHVKTFLKKVKWIKKSLNGLLGVTFYCSTSDEMKSKGSEAETILGGGFFGLNSVKLLHSSVRHRPAERMASLVFHEMSHLRGSRDYLYFSEYGNVMGGEENLHFKKWYKNADHFEYFFYHKFTLEGKSCSQ